MRQLLNRAVRRLLEVAFYKPLPSTSLEEEMYLAELKDAFLSVPILDRRAALPSLAIWIDNQNELRKHILTDDPRGFLRWKVISEAMCVHYARYIKTELNYLKQRPDWPRWKAAIKESRVGHPIPYFRYPQSSGTLIHHAYHIAKLQEMTGVNLQDLELVFEFGGGYGSTCRLLHNLGFRGQYVIYDLPPFSALQRYYLKTQGIKAMCVSTTVNLPRTDKSLFIAEWSMSEAPLSAREPIIPLVQAFKYFLIAYQPTGGEVDNIEFFGKLQRTIQAEWHTLAIGHLPGNAYLFGAKRG